MWVLSQKISQRGGDVRQEECCSIKHKHKPQHTSAHMLLTPSQIHTQNQPPHCKETSTFQSSSWGSILFITKVSPFFVAALNIKDKKNPKTTLDELSFQTTTIMTGADNDWGHLLANEPKVGVGLWQNLHGLTTAMLTSYVWRMTGYHPNHTWHLSPLLTSRPNTNGAFMVLISILVYQWLNLPTSVTRRASLSSVRAALTRFSFHLRRQVKAFQKLFSSLIMWWRMNLDADVQGDSSTAAWRGAYLVLSFVKSIHKWSRCDLKLREKQRLGAAVGRV